MATTDIIVPREHIERYIFLIRGQKVLLSTHLADLYRVEPRALIQAVRRNMERFPKDFMFQLTQAEWENLKSQIVISSWGGLRRATPYAFTEQGVAMLSSVLRSKRAVQGQRRNHASFCPLTPDACLQRRSGRKARCSGKEIRCSVQGRF